LCYDGFHRHWASGLVRCRSCPDGCQSMRGFPFGAPDRSGAGGTRPQRSPHIDYGLRPRPLRPTRFKVSETIFRPSWGSVKEKAPAPPRFARVVALLRPSGLGTVRHSITDRDQPGLLSSEGGCSWGPAARLDTCAALVIGARGYPPGALCR